LDPHPSTLFTDDSHVAVYFPSRNTMEVYPVDRRISVLMMSPVPRITVLRQHFTLEVLPKSTPKALVLRMTPKEEALLAFVDEIVVSVSVERGLADRIEISDPEGDRTVITFRNVRTNVGLSDADVARRVPDDTEVIYPLEADPHAPAEATRSNHE
jgi:outer membrane lipoprotein-sorting protein